MPKGIIRSPFIVEIPYAFIYNDTYLGTTSFHGSYIETLQTFAQVFHYDLRLDYRPEFADPPDLLEDIAEGYYNTTLHGALIPTPNDSNINSPIRFSYPLDVMENCVMVPLPPELPKWMYIVWPLGRYVWTTLFLGIFYVAFLLRFVHWNELAAKSYTRNLLHALALIMYSPNSNMPVQMTQVPVRSLVFYLLLYIQGFIITTYHISHMTTYDMKPVFVKPIDTWEDLIESEVRIIIPDGLLKSIISLAEVDVSSLYPQFEKRSWPAYQDMLVEPSRDFAYVVNLDYWILYNRQQVVLIQPYFHMSEVCFNSYFNALPIKRGARIADELDRFILYIQESGLWDFWEDMAFVYALRANYAQVFRDDYPVEPLDMEFLNTAWMVFFVGLPISLVVYIAEHCWWRLTSHKRVRH